MDPFTLFALASGAVNAVKKGCELYKEIKGVAGNVKDIIKIACPIHGLFEQKASTHKYGSGCPKCVGKNKELEASRKKVDDLINKEANAKIKELIGNIKEYVPEFPNNESSEKFLDTLLHIAKFYDGIIAATKKDKEDSEFMPIDLANELINDLREYVKHVLDAELKSSYTTFNEAEEEDNSIGDIENYDRRRKKELLQLRSKIPADEEEFSSERMKTLRSWKLPLALFGVGGALGGLSWLLDLLKDKADFLYVLKGEGMTQILNRAGERGGWGLPKLGPDSPLSDVTKYITKVGEGNYETGIDRLAADNGMFQDPNAAQEALSQMSNADQNTTAGDFFKNKLAGTGKSPGDMLVTKALGPLLLKAAARSAAPWMGKFASGLGVALLVGSAAVALARLKGRKSSRAASLNLLYQSLKNIKPTEENPTVVPVENTPGGPPQVDNTSTPTQTSQNSQTPQEKLQGDVQVVRNDFENNAAVKTALSRIDTADDLRNLILQMSQYVSANLKKDKANLRSSLYGIANQLKGKKMQEDYSFQTTDSESAAKAVEAAKTLVQHLQKINTREEFAQLIRQILPYIDPKGKITQDRSKLVNIIYGAANQIDKFVADRDKNPAHKPGGLG